MGAEFNVDTDNGLIEPARQCSSPNQDERPDGVSPELIVVHGISLPPGEYGGPEIEQFFMNGLDCDSHAYFDQIRDLKVSTHMLIRRNGEIVQFVPFTRRAWHAGESTFRNRTCCNDFSIGIELEGIDDMPYDDRQYEILIATVAELLRAYSTLSARGIVAHSDIAPDRKTDPGPAFDWLRLYDGLGHELSQENSDS